MDNQKLVAALNLIDACECALTNSLLAFNRFSMKYQVNRKELEAALIEADSDLSYDELRSFITSTEPDIEIKFKVV